MIRRDQDSQFPFFSLGLQSTDRNMPILDELRCKGRNKGLAVVGSVFPYFHLHTKSCDTFVNVSFVKCRIIERK